MKKFFIVLIITLSPISLWANKSFNSKFIFAAKSARQSVVYISVYAKNNESKKNNFVKIAYGSGTIFTKSGYIITNYHVVKKGEYCLVNLPDGTELEVSFFKNGKYYLADKKTDLAILKLKTNKELTPITFGNSDKLSEGEWVLAIGNPYGLRHSISSGIVSSKGRHSVGFTDIEDFIQTDVPINPGNSGGPLINLNGELVGINTAIRTASGGYQGISFAIPSSMILKVFNDLIKYKRVRRGWLGLIVKNEYNKELKRNVVRVISVIKNSPAAYSGIHDGDILCQINNIKITSKGSLMSIVKSKQIGEKLQLSVLRSGHNKTFKIFLKEKKQFQNISKAIKKFYNIYGIELDINASSDDLIVSSVSPLKLFIHQNSLKSGDIVTAINGIYFNNTEKFTQVLKKFKYNINSIEIVRDSRIYVIDFIK